MVRTKNCDESSIIYRYKTFYRFLWNSIEISHDGNIFRVTGPLWRDFTGHRWIGITKASDALLFSLVCARTNGLINNRDAGDLRCHSAYIDVTVMVRVLYVWLLTEHLYFVIANKICNLSNTNLTFIVTILIHCESKNNHSAKTGKVVWPVHTSSCRENRD